MFKRLFALSTAWLLGALVVGCPLEDPGPPYRVLIHAYQGEGEYELSETELPTLLSLHGIEGEVTGLIGGVDIAVDVFATADTEEEIVDAIVIRGGKPVEPRFFMNDGVVIPEDFGSLLFFTYYSHIERCRDFFHAHGLPSELPGHIPTFALPTVGTTQLGGFHLIKDNAAFSPTFGAFALFSRQMLRDQLPLAMNLGVVCHEYSHAVFHAVIAGDSKVPVGMMAGWSTGAENLMRSVDEGMADIFGALMTIDADFIVHSVPRELGIERGLDEVREVTRELSSARFSESLFYDPYPLGSVFASVLWSTKEEIGRQVLGESAIRAIYEIGRIAGPSFQLSDVSEALFSGMDESGRPRLCEAMVEASMPEPAGCEAYE